MLAEMDGGQLAEWRAFFKIEEDEYRRAELKARAEAGVRSHKRGGR